MGGIDSPFQLVLREEHEEEHGEGVALGHAGHGDEGSGHPARLRAEVARLPHVDGVWWVCISGRNLKKTRIVNHELIRLNQTSSYLIRIE